MTIPSVNSTSSARSTASTFSVTAPAGISAGDLLVAVQSVAAGNVNPTTPTGWTSRHSRSWNGAAGRLNVYDKVASGSEPGSYTFNGGGASVESEVIIYDLINAGTAIDVSAGNSGIGSTATASITGSAGGLLIEAVATTPIETVGTSTHFSFDSTEGLANVLACGSDAGFYNGSASSVSHAIGGGGIAAWAVVMVSIPITVPITQLTRQPSQQFYPLPDYNYAWWQEHAQRPQAAWYVPPVPSTRQPSQQFHQLPNVDWVWYEQVRSQPVPLSYVPTPPATKQPSQRFYPLPDYWQEYQVYIRQKATTTYAPQNPLPAKAPQPFYALPDLTWRWWQQTTHWPIPVQYIPDKPATHQPSQQFYELPDYNWMWWEQLRLHPLPSGIFQSQEGVAGIFNLMVGVGQVGGSRVAETAIEGWNVYIGAGGLPNLAQPPAAFSTTLPIITPLTPPGSGTETFFILVQKQDRYGLQSQNQFYTTVTIDSNGNLFLPALVVPQGLQLYPRAGGFVTVLVTYPGASTDKYPATSWKIWQGATLPDPNLDTPVAIYDVSGKVLQTVIGPYPPGTYYVLVALYRLADMSLSPSIYAQVTIPSLPGEVTAVPSGFDL